MSKIIKKRILPMLLTLSIVMSMLGVLPIGVFALEQKCQIGDYNFVELNGNFCAITKYNGSDSEVTIPSTLDGLMVQKISSGAFKNNTTLEKVVLSQYIETVESEVFRGCTSLTTITLNDELSCLGSYMFYGCSNLTSIDFPETLTTIKAYAFNGCTSLESIEIPDSVTTISGDAFYGCTKLASVKLPLGWVTTPDYHDWTSYGDSDSDYRSPFRGCAALKEISFPNGMTTVPNHAFRNATSIETVVLPDTIQT